MQILSKITPALLFCFFVLLYVHNLSPSVYGGDVGDFVTAAYVGGVAHAPGYPFFVFLGFLLIHLLPFFTPAFAMGLISAFAGAGGIVALFLIVRMLTKNSLVGVVATVTLGFSYLFWFYNEIAEVFALHSFFILSLFYFAFTFNTSRKKKWLWLFAFVFGLAAVTHQTIVLFVPSYLLLLFPTWWRSKKRFKVLSISALLTLSAGLWYVYVFIASSHHPVINWDNVHNLSSFLTLLLRKDYGTFQAGLLPTLNWSQRLVILRTYLFEVLTQVSIPVVVVSVVGIISIWRKSWRYAVSLLLAFLISGPLFVGYAGFPLEGSFFLGVYERFFTMSTLPLYMAFGYGLYVLAKGLTDLFERKAYFALIPLLFLLVPLQLFIFNMPKTDLSHVWVGDMLGIDLLNPLPPHSVLFVGGDTVLFDTWYVHYARHIRSDIQLINLSNLSSNPFFQQQEKVVKKHKPHIKGNDLVVQTMKEIVMKYPVFSYDQLQSPGKIDLHWIPYGLVYRLSLSSEIPTKAQFLATSIKKLKEVHLPYGDEENYHNFTIAQIPEVYAKSVWAIGNYFLDTYKDADTAIEFYNKAIAIAPDFENTYLTLGIAYLNSKNDCLRAKETFEKAINLKPYDEFPYFLLYSTYTECYHDTTSAKTVTQAFDSQFHKDFFSELSSALKQLNIK